MPSPRQVRQWHHQADGQTFTVSTSRDLISRDFVHASFADPATFWARPVAADVLETMLENSLFFGLYVQSSTDTGSASSTQIGMARLVTDFTTTAFLTDVLVLPDYRGKGLAKWMLRCVKECTDALPAPRRRLMFMAKNEAYAKKFYEEVLGASVHDQERGKVVFMSTTVEGLDS